MGPKRLNLVKQGNAEDPSSDSVRLDVLIDETGDLVMEGEDTGPPSNGSGATTSTSTSTS